jgi:cell division protein FtsB
MSHRLFDRNRHEGMDERWSGIFSGVSVLRLLVIVLLVLNLLLIHRLFLSGQGAEALRKQTEQVAEMEKRILELREENQRLFNRIQGFKGNVRAQEKLVREQLGWARDNELMIEFPAKDLDVGERKSP